MKMFRQFVKSNYQTKMQLALSRSTEWIKFMFSNFSDILESLKVK